MSLFRNLALVALLASVNALPSPFPQHQVVDPNTQPPTNLCGNDQNIILEGTPWLVANSMYGAGSMVGSACTYYDHIEGGSQVIFKSTTSIQEVDSTYVILLLRTSKRRLGSEY